DRTRLSHEVVERSADLLDERPAAGLDGALRGVAVVRRGRDRQPGLLLDGLGLVARHAEPLRHGRGDVAAADRQDADEARDAALVHDDVRDVGTDVDSASAWNPLSAPASEET